MRCKTRCYVKQHSVCARIITAKCALSLCSRKLGTSRGGEMRKNRERARALARKRGGRALEIKRRQKKAKESKRRQKKAKESAKRETHLPSYQHGESHRGGVRKNESDRANSHAGVRALESERKRQETKESDRYWKSGSETDLASNELGVNHGCYTQATQLPQN